MEKNEPKTPAAILQAALARELEARDFYADLSAHCHIDFIKSLLEKLRSEEARHVAMVQEMIDRFHNGTDIV